MIAILGDESAPSEIDFPMELPQGAQLVQQEDGSIAVMAELEMETVSEEDAARFSEAADAVLGPNPGDTLTDEQIDALNTIPAPETYTTKKMVQVGAIGAPWAVDANGDVVDTRYEITGDGITQVIETAETTAFPVTADPWFSFLPKSIQTVLNVVKMLVVSNTVFAKALGLWVKAKTLKSSGKCRWETSYGIDVCWGGKLQWMAGGGGTTYGTTFLFKNSKDPKTVAPYTNSTKYTSLMKHESAHMKQWKVLGPAFASTYVAAMGVSLFKTGTYACGNLYEMMAGFKDGGYDYC